MKIALNIDNLDRDTNGATQAKALEKTIMAVKKGDFEARDVLFQHYMPLLTSLAKKRCRDVTEINQRIEEGKKGLLTAAQKYKPSVGPDRFKLFALDYIEKAMDRKTKQGGLLSHLFGSK